MLKRIIPLLAVLAALFWTRAAEASHFRYGTIAWTVPNPQTAPLAVTFTVTTAWRLANIGQTSLDFGDGTPANPNTTGVSIGTGTDAGGNAYGVQEYTVAHIYAAAGTYTAFFQSSARIAGLINGASASFRVETKVGLSPGNTSGPVSSAPAIIQMQTGGVRTYTFPSYDPDGDVVTCRFATSAEMWSSNTAADGPIPAGTNDIPTEPVGNTKPTLTNTAAGCVVTWDLTQAAPGKQYVIHLVLESTHGGQLSSTAIDLIIETVLAPPPTCAGSGTFTANIGQVFTTSTTGTNVGGGTLAFNTTNAPAGSTLNPASGTSGPSPRTNSFTWTPTALFAGTTQIVQMNYTNSTNSTGTCFLTIQVPQCSNFGAACTVGVGACQATGTNVCAGPGITVCSVVAGVPTPEVCDGLDNDCNGVVDNGNPGGGVACVSGLPGVCSGGTTACTNSALACNANVTPGAQTETCDGKDNNCDGTIDEGFGLGTVCSAGVGACTSAGVLTCDGTGAASCNAIPGVSIPEVCSDLTDNDCDGTVNNGCLDTDGDGLPDLFEVAIGTNPNDADSDDDGVPDGQEPSLSEDSDGDGLINALDPDSDNDGLYDGTELGKDCANPATDSSKHHCIADADPTTTTDPLNADTDGGGVKDGSEDANRDGKVDANEGDPTAGHGADDSTLIDTDGDGLTDIFEIAIGTNPNDADSDDDGVIDGKEPNPADDTDGDGLINALDPDSDNDGLYDGTEMGLDCANPATDNSKHHCIADADDGGNTTSPLDPDTDHGGKKDGSEDANRNGKVDPGEGDPTAGHGADDATLVDTDGDGLTDIFEDAIGTDKNDADTDNDGVIDGLEPNPADDTDGDGLINALDPDSDNDGLYDGTEMGKDCSNPATNAALGHCIADADPATTTSPLDPDTDKGGVKDGSEDANGNGKLDAGETDPTAGHGADDATNKDTDGDGLSDILEVAIGTDPMDADTDNDGVIDGQEPNPTDDTDGDGLINALDPDSDNDGLYDGTELGLGCSNPATDATKMHCIPDADMGATVTDPLDADTDDGGVSDGSEDVNRNGAIDGTETDPTAGHGADDTNPVNLDSDGDGLSDGLEGLIGTDPNDADTDNDGVIDGKEPNPTDDTDGDGKINALDPDSDNDGLFDGTELGLDCSNPATDATKMQCIPDADMGATKTNPLDPDTDHGSVKDGTEDANHNGKVDAGETDPNVKADDVPATGCTTDVDCGTANSGKICDDATKTCVDGCRGMGGNGCPDGRTCSSVSATAGMCVDSATSSTSASTGTGGAGGGGGAGGATDRIVASGNGLICSATPGNSNEDTASWLVGGAILALAGSRRRRRAA